MEVQRLLLPSILCQIPDLGVGFAFFVYSSFASAFIITTDVTKLISSTITQLTPHYMGYFITSRNMAVISDYYTRSQAYKNAHRHGSIGHPQDISFLDEWYIDENAPDHKRTRPRRQERRAILVEEAVSESELESEDDLQDILVWNAKTYIVSSPHLIYTSIATSLMLYRF